jgi:AcrR family transcriptional regulator
MAPSERSLTRISEIAEEVRAGRRRLNADERREAILEAAWTIFARSGYHRASTQEIAAAAGCSEPMIYKHFASKQALFCAVLERGKMCIKERWLDLLAEIAEDPAAAYAADPLGIWSQVIARLVDDPIYAESARIRLFALALADDPEIGGALRAAVSRQVDMATETFVRGQEQGGVRRDVDPAVGAWLLASVSMVGAVRNATQGQDGLHDMPAFIETLVGLLRPPGDAPQGDLA